MKDRIEYRVKIHFCGGSKCDIEAGVRASTIDRLSWDCEHNEPRQGKRSAFAIEHVIRRFFGASASLFQESGMPGIYGQIVKPCSAGGLNCVTGRVSIYAVEVL